MKIGILTHCGTLDNYGQVLQCYALQYYLKEQGHQPFLIKYNIGYSQTSGSLLRDIAHCLYSLVSPSHRKVYSQLQEDIKLGKENKVKNQVRRFDVFYREHIESTDKFYHSISELKDELPEADAYIVGSDQVWNDSLAIPDNDAWFLRFVPKGKVRIAYAVSSGRDVPEAERDRFIEYVNDFDAVSVREERLLNLCQSLGIKKSRLVLDPTLLVNFNAYQPFLIEENDKQPYLFLYYLNIRTKEELKWNGLSSFLEREKIELLPVCSSGYYPARDLIPQHTPRLLTIPEWLSSMYNSKYVVTTSFHGLAFALCMHKPFAAILLGNQFSGGNERIISLLKKVGLENRVVRENGDFAQILHTRIDWNKVDNHLQGLREESISFLNNALQ